MPTFKGISPTIQFKNCKTQSSDLEQANLASKMLLKLLQKSKLQALKSRSFHIKFEPLKFPFFGARALVKSSVFSRLVLEPFWGYEMCHICIGLRSQFWRFSMLSCVTWLQLQLFRVKEWAAKINLGSTKPNQIMSDGRGAAAVHHLHILKSAISHKMNLHFSIENCISLA